MSARYRVGCAGMFVLGTDYGCDDRDGALVACETGPVGCEVHDTLTGEWIGPTCQEEIDEAKARLDTRASGSVALALARLGEDLERLSPVMSASVAAPREASWPAARAWVVCVRLDGRSAVTTCPRFDCEADALVFREGAHEALGQAT